MNYRILCLKNNLQCSLFATLVEKPKCHIAVVFGGCFFLYTNPMMNLKFNLFKNNFFSSSTIKSNNRLDPRSGNKPNYRGLSYKEDILKFIGLLTNTSTIF